MISELFMWHDVNEIWSTYKENINIIEFLSDRTLLVGTAAGTTAPCHIAKVCSHELQHSGTETNHLSAILNLREELL